MRPIFTLSIIFFALTQIVSPQENDNLEAIIDQIQQKYEKINDFNSKFTQEATVRALNQVQKAKGEVWFKKPGKMRWNYYTPTTSLQNGTPHLMPFACWLVWMPLGFANRPSSD